ncbi:Formate dehydrogenase-O major subunit precursor [Chromobacterium violaceum]|uniref:Formate dehydrogenase-O major subunit n=1 Tax=Chromobacterium violaceum TaxID=536 RepID=A0A447TCP1_CHRVL|nr:Formate dehydrogenase-O major subunit precursor [Chromobacterium violaceum]
MDKTETRSTCCYCGVGCGVLIASENGRIVGVRGDPDHPANYGRLCGKGLSLAASAASDSGRALFPEMRPDRASRAAASAGTRRWTRRPTASPTSSAATVPTRWPSTRRANC